MTTTETLPPEAARHRESFAEFVRENATGPYADILKRLYGCFAAWNDTHFHGQLTWPHILLAEPKSSRALGDYAAVSGWGSRGQVRIRPSLYTGEHPSLKAGEQFREGRILYVEDVLLHELVHLFTDEILHQDESSYHGHGPGFARECNRIGEAFGLPAVGPKRSGLPHCGQWPENVRPEGYYLGALVEPTIKSGPTPKGQQSQRQLTPLGHLTAAHDHLHKAAQHVIDGVLLALQQGEDIPELFRIAWRFDPATDPHLLVPMMPPNRLEIMGNLAVAMVFGKGGLDPEKLRLLLEEQIADDHLLTDKRDG